VNRASAPDCAAGSPSGSCAAQPGSLRGADPGVSAKFSREQAQLNQKLLTAMTRRSAKLDKLRRDRRLRTIPEIWPVTPIPLSFALLATLIAHMVSVFYYW